MLGASAEWILERPSDSNLATVDGPLFPLPDYNAISLSRCATRMDNSRPSCWCPRMLQMAEIIPKASHLFLESVSLKREQPRYGFRLEYRQS